MEIKPYREITVEGVILGLIIGAVMTVAFTYAGMVMGFGIGGSSVAAILGWGILRGIFRKGTIVENNINQTIASGINISSAGVIFTVPALYLMGIEFSFVTAAIACAAGALIGIAFIIPLRKQMIDIERLRFPTGMAVATILKSPGAGIQKSILLVVGLMIAVIVTLLIQAHPMKWVNNMIIPELYNAGERMGMPGYIVNIWAISLFALGAGFITGKAGLLILVGGILANWIIIPIAVGANWYPQDMDVTVYAQAKGVWGYFYSQINRPIGIGMLVGGALMGIVVAFPSIRAAFVSLHRSSARKGGMKSQELPIKFAYIAAVAAFICIFLVTKFASDFSVLRALAMAVAGVAWIWLAGIIVAQCTGMTDWSPLSGLSLIGVTIVLLIGMCGGNPLSAAVVPAVLIGAATCLAAGQCADMMQDLKTGFVVGAKPIRQQILQVCVVWIGPIIALIVIGILWKAGDGGEKGFGPGTKIEAPQAQALQATVEAFSGQNAPYTKYLAGAIIGGLLSFSGIAGLGVLVGLSMYLPMFYILPYGVGCIIHMILSKAKGRRWCEDYGVPVAAGFIVGEACVMCALAFIKVAMAGATAGA
jgi:putative OPT family oligopeptide transporter